MLLPLLVTPWILIPVLLLTLPSIYHLMECGYCSREQQPPPYDQVPQS